MKSENLPSEVNQMNNEITNEFETPTYQPLTLEAYKFFIKFAPYVEKNVLKSINKCVHHSPQELQELKAFSKLDKEFLLSKELIEYLNLNGLKNSEINFNCKVNSYSY